MGVRWLMFLGSRVKIIYTFACLLLLQVFSLIYNVVVVAVAVAFLLRLGDLKG